jgi:hypothetical protein
MARRLVMRIVKTTTTLRYFKQRSLEEIQKLFMNTK